MQNRLRNKLLENSTGTSICLAKVKQEMWMIDVLDFNVNKIYSLDYELWRMCFAYPLITRNQEFSFFFFAFSAVMTSLQYMLS